MTAFWIGTSWKMHKTLAEGLAFADALRSALPAIDARIQPFVMPSFTAVREIKQALAGTRVKVGAQTMHWDDEGPWTGEVSPVMLADCRLDMVELGHSERRTHFGETDRTVGLKVAAALRHGLVPLVCVGETLAERDAGRAEAMVTAQVAAALAEVSGATGPREILFAYEPVWAIGSHGTPARADYADRQQALIKAVAGPLLSRVPTVLYGGSVNAGNAADLIRQPHVDGLFVGRAAWEADGYLDILARAAAALSR